MAEKSAGAILASTIEKIRDLVDTSTIIGEAIYAEGGTTIIPVSKVTYGFASGGADFPSKGSKELFGLLDELVVQLLEFLLAILLYVLGHTFLYCLL